MEANRFLPKRCTIIHYMDFDLLLQVSSTFQRHAEDEDGQWSQGLISAARMVAAATHSLCEAANAMVQVRSSVLHDIK